jgi:hypothetical protein
MIVAWAMDLLRKALQNENYFYLKLSGPGREDGIVNA